MTHVSTAHRSAARTAGSHRGPSFSRLVRSEWLKAVSLRSTRWSMLAGIAATIVIAVPTGLDPASSTRGVLIACAALSTIVTALIGVLLATSEYTTGTIVPTMLATPRRLPVIGAKLVVASSIGIIIAVAGTVASFALLAGIDGSDPLAWAQPATIGSALGVLVAHVVTAAFSVLFGQALRSAVSAVAAVLGVMVVLPVLSIGFGDPAVYLNELGIADGARALVAPDLGAPLWQSGIVVLVWIGVCGAWSLAALRARDV